MKVEEKIGKLIKVDDDVELVTRRQFARIYVQVDMTKSFFWKNLDCINVFKRSSMKEFILYAFLAECMDIGEKVVR